MLKKVWSIGGYSDSRQNKENEVLSFNPSFPIGLTKDYVEDRALESIIGCSYQNIYADYLEFCKKNNFYPMTKHGLLKGIREDFNCYAIIRKIDGKSHRILVPLNYGRGKTN